MGNVTPRWTNRNKPWLIHSGGHPKEITMRTKMAPSNWITQEWIHCGVDSQGEIMEKPPTTLAWWVNPKGEPEGVLATVYFCCETAGTLLQIIATCIHITYSTFLLNILQRNQHIYQHIPSTVPIGVIGNLPSSELTRLYIYIYRKSRFLIGKYLYMLDPNLCHGNRAAQLLPLGRLGARVGRLAMEIVSYHIFLRWLWPTKTIQNQNKILGNVQKLWYDISNQQNSALMPKDMAISISQMTMSI